jgi:ubiquinone/menaquinone biosynthesis C-methylase UbiE
MSQRASKSLRATPVEGWRGWNEYAEFYDWENARTMGRRDLAYWTAFARQAGGPVLELGCGTGRVTAPLVRAGVSTTGVDRSEGMLDRARQRLRRLPAARLVRADIGRLPFADASFCAVIAPYGILQSLLSDRVLADTLASVTRVLAPGSHVGLELVPDVPRWQETDRRVSLVGLDGPHGKPVTLVESVHQDRRRRLTTFEHEFLEGTGRARRSLRFTIRFRTIRVPAMIRRLERAGLAIEGTHGGYRGEAWTEEAGTWLIVARKPGVRRGVSGS